MRRIQLFTVLYNINMQKLDGRKCDGCGMLLHPSTTVELCPECANSVWVVMNIYENGFEELSAIYRTAEDAKAHVNSLKDLTEKLNKTAENKLTRTEINKWIVA